jgi:chromosome segregation ATPase
MKKLLIVVLVLVVALGGVAYWRGWFSLGNGKVQTDPEKFKKDKAALVEKAKSAGKKMADLFKSKATMTAEDKAKLDELKKEHERLEAKLKAAEEAGEEKFDNEKEALTKALEDVDKKMDELTKKLEKSKDKDK